MNKNADYWCGGSMCFLSNRYSHLKYWKWNQTQNVIFLIKRQRTIIRYLYSIFCFKYNKHLFSNCHKNIRRDEWIIMNKTWSYSYFLYKKMYSNQIAMQGKLQLIRDTCIYICFCSLSASIFTTYHSIAICMVV